MQLTFQNAALHNEKDADALVAVPCRVKQRLLAPRHPEHTGRPHDENACRLQVVWLAVSMCACSAGHPSTPLPQLPSHQSPSSHLAVQPCAAGDAPQVARHTSQHTKVLDRVSTRVETNEKTGNSERNSRRVPLEFVEAPSTGAFLVRTHA